MQSCYKPRVDIWGRLQDNKCLNEQFDGVSCIDSQLGDHDCGYPSRCITDRSVFNGHQVGRIRVRCHQGECRLAACICLRHTSPSPGLLIWGAVGYTFRSSLYFINSALNNTRYISSVLQHVALPFIRILQ
ncbi:uncharacterized protein TNCV_255301 [Trichonephila clavipes]|nr:uncharacterized protein TNCV_255301 [Trichonephila clavipes]